MALQLGHPIRCAEIPGEFDRFRRFLIGKLHAIETETVSGRIDHNGRRLSHRDVERDGCSTVIGTVSAGLRYRIRIPDLNRYQTGQVFTGTRVAGIDRQFTGSRSLEREETLRRLAAATCLDIVRGGAGHDIVLHRLAAAVDVQAVIGEVDIVLVRIDRREMALNLGDPLAAAEIPGQRLLRTAGIHLVDRQLGRTGLGGNVLGGSGDRTGNYGDFVLTYRQGGRIGGCNRVSSSRQSL